MDESTMLLLFLYYSIYRWFSHYIGYTPGAVFFYIDNEIISEDTICNILTLLINGESCIVQNCWHLIMYLILVIH